VCAPDGEKTKKMNKSSITGRPQSQAIQKKTAGWYKKNQKRTRVGAAGPLDSFFPNVLLFSVSRSRLGGLGNFGGERQSSSGLFSGSLRVFCEQGAFFSFWKGRESRGDEITASWAIRNCSREDNWSSGETKKNRKAQAYREGNVPKKQRSWGPAKID